MDPMNYTPPTQPAPAYATSCLKAAWEDVKATPNYVSRLLVLGLIMCVPILNFVVAGYLLFWSREVPFGGRSLLPEKIVTGKNFEYGFYAFVLTLVVGLIGGIIGGIFGWIPFIGWVVSIAVSLATYVAGIIMQMRMIMGQSLGDGSGGFLCKFREVTLCAQEKILLRLHSLGKGAAQFRVKRQGHHPCGQRHQQHPSTKKHLPPQQGVSTVFTGWTRGRRFLAFALWCGIFPHGPHLLLPDCMQAGSQIEQQYKSSGSPCVRHKLSPPFYVLQIIRPGLCAAFPGAHPAASGAW